MATAQFGSLLLANTAPLCRESSFDSMHDARGAMLGFKSWHYYGRICRRYSVSNLSSPPSHIFSLLKTAYMSFLKRTHPDTLARYSGNPMVCSQNEKLIQWANDLMEYCRRFETQSDGPLMVKEIIGKCMPFRRYDFYLKSIDEAEELQLKSLFLDLKRYDGTYLATTTIAKSLVCDIFTQVFMAAALDCPIIRNYLATATVKSSHLTATTSEAMAHQSEPPITEAYETLLTKDLSSFDLHSPTHLVNEDEFLCSLQKNIPLLEFYQDIKRYVVFPLCDTTERLSSLSALYSAKKKIRYMKWKFPLLKIIFYGDHYVCHSFSVLQLPSGLDAKDLKFYLEHAEGMFMRRQDYFIDPFSLPIYIDGDK